MRRYDDPVEVRKGMVDGFEGPEQFLWRGRLWKVHVVLAHWVETGSWWESAQAGSPAGSPAGSRAGSRPRGTEEEPAAVAVLPDLIAEREVWRVEASPGRVGAANAGRGVFDLLFDWAEGGWRLTGCLD